MAGTPKGPISRAVNGPLYKVAHFLTAYINVPPNKHRVFNAVGLTLGIVGGRWGMNILTGQKPNGDKINVEDVPLPLRPLHGILAYDHFSDDHMHRWMKIMDMTLPAILGGIGAGMGSDFFFKDRLAKTQSKLAALATKNPDDLNKAVKNFSLADAENKAMYHQARVWGGYSKLASVFGSSSGFGLIPSWLNYSSTLGTKFTQDAGRKMVARWMPKNLRAAIFNNHCLEPFGPVKLVESTILHLAHNPDIKNPESAIHSIEGFVKTWFNHATPAQVNTFKENVLKLNETVRHEITELAKHNPKLIQKGEEAVRKHITAEVERELGRRLNTGLFTEATEKLLTGKGLNPSRLVIGTEAATKLLLKKGLDPEKIAQEYAGLEKRLIEAGIDPREAAIGKDGVLTTFARWVGDLMGRGTSTKLRESQALMIQGMEMRHPELKTLFPNPKIPDLAKSNVHAKVLAGTFAGTGVATIAAISTAKDTSVKDLKPADGKTEEAPENAPPSSRNASDGSEPHITPASFSRSPGHDSPAPARKHTIHSKKNEGFINGRVLDATEGITGMFNAAIGMHRVHCGIGLWLGSWFGDEIMKAMTGFKLDGTVVKKEELWKPLRKIHNILPSNPHSDLAKDKWLQVLRWGVPAVLGTGAVIQASKIFFQERTDRVRKAKYLDEMDDKVAMAQSQPWSYTSAISGLFGYPSGMPLLPFVNYSTNLGTRFSMASNRKVAMPIVGKIWSNNSTLFPFGPPGMINLMIREAVNNKKFDPELLETYAIGVLKPWFDNVTPQQVESFVMKVHETRDKFFKEGGVPEEMKKQLESELKAHLKGAGLEETLREVGLDPTQAHLGNNGLSGTIANILGAKHSVEKIQKDYTQGYLERLQKEQQKSPDNPHSIA